MFDQSLIEGLVSQNNYYRDQKEVRELRNKAIRMSHKHHFENNAFYRKFCKAKGITEEVSPKDFHDLLVPDGVFKSYELENPEKEPLKFKKWVDGIASIKTDFIPKKTNSLEEMLEEYDRNGMFLGYSSGTSGKLTFLPRDGFTRSMIVRSYVEAVDATVKINKGKDHFVLGIPGKTFLQVGFNGRTTAEDLSPGNIFFAMKELKSDIVRIRMRGPRSPKEYAMNELIKRMMPGMENNAVSGLAGELLKRKNERVIFMAPPFLIVNTARYVLDNGLDAKLSQDSILASTGGFKGRKVTSRDDMNRLIKEAFGVDENRYIDLYGMTESNSIMVECMEGNNKHIPPWMEVVLFDDHMEPIEPKGKVTGYYGFLEASSRSFPGFIMTGDKITVDYDGCSACDKKTPVVSGIGRAPLTEGRGCAGVLSKTVGGA
ncbi:hypothetical protein CUJ83_09705 [Methanocella sp. CWC-04]|uniref:Acyl-protein synthetase LuxE domain-containing protein n=1 Tax=Methanooceanicella nereidis TaxID=2052831 RepID=A0AAP2W6F4_9EURY|nr:hypothetical protein [Methanocella sp. CWC-04]MCD1295273.1 hypothetical protein [Methanocella sp. CWC-04]